MSKVLMKGNDAVAEAVVRAGCRFFAGYPITPQSEILEYLSWRLPELGGRYLQSESEVSGISMTYGAAACGFRAFTSSSGPGFSLMQEGISYIASAELPCVLMNVQRYGSGLGDIFVGQSDYWQSVRNGGHGDYRLIVYAPNSVQECIDFVMKGFDIAEKYCNPVLILSDAAIAQMMEPVELPPFYKDIPDDKSWALKGKGIGKYKRHTSVMYYKADYDNYLSKKYAFIESNEQAWESIKCEDAEIVVVAYGITSRLCEEAIVLARNNGIKVGMIRPITLFPFPAKAFQSLTNVKSYLCVEISVLHQMAEDVDLVTSMKHPVYRLGSGTNVFEAKDIYNKIIEVANEVE